ncbi:MAG: GyrI-like domain-containing protein [Chloroflexota bacterium]
MIMVQVKQVDSFLLAGLSFFGDPFHTHAGWTEANEIGRLWKRLMNNKKQSQPTMYEVHIQHENSKLTGEFEVFVGFEVSDWSKTQPDLCLKVLPASLYAVFTFKGEALYQDEALVDRWLEAEGYKTGHPYFIQRFDQRFKGIDRLDQSELDFLVPIIALES